MTFEQFHRENVAQLWREWTPPKDLTKWESGACFIAFIRERYEAAQKKAEQVDLFSNSEIEMIEPYWTSNDGRHVVYCGNCADILQNIGKIDVVITDPPYGTKYYKTDDDKDVVDVLLKHQRKAVFGYPEIMCGWCMKLGKPDEWITWWPTNKIAGRSKGLSKESEVIALWGRLYEIPLRKRDHQILRFLSVDRNKKMNKGFAKCGDVWRDPSPGMAFNYHLRQHPNEKPLSLMCKLVKLCSEDNETILDPFMGSGTTGVACVRLNRKFIGIEISKEYCDIAVERIKRELSQPRLELEPQQSFEQTKLFDGVE